MNENSWKQSVYLSEFNVQMGDTVYVPFVSGLLRAYAESQVVIQEHYEFQPFVFVKDDLDTLVAKYEQPDVAGFSLSMWNEQFTLQLAKHVKERFPECLIVFGGPQVPHRPEAYFKEHTFIDVAVRGEGETAFANILAKLVEGRTFEGIPGISWQHPDTGECIRNEEENLLRKNLDEYPSPYLIGLYDYLFEDYPHLNFQAIVETNRGCPFPCTFCFWGQGGLNTRLRYHTVERVKSELEWIAKHQIRYVFNADANFGMYKQDLEIAQALVDTNKRYGYPEKFRTCFGKNTDDQIYEIAQLMHRENLEKGITLARQSNTAEVLENIRRKNIKMDTYLNLQERFDEINIPVYTEMILGLPGETYDTWTEGIEALLGTAMKNQLFIYLCQVYPNTELDSPEYREQFGIITQRIPLNETHGSIHEEDEIVEFENVIVGTSSLPTEDWQQAVLFSWTTMALHSMKLGYFIMAYLADRYQVGYTDFVRYICELRMPESIGSMLRAEVTLYNHEVERILSGEGRGQVLREFGPIYWDQEEATFLRACEDLDTFYAEMLDVLYAYLDAAGLSYDRQEIAEVVQYQRARMPSRHAEATTDYEFQYNIPEYFGKRFGKSPIGIKPSAQIMTASQKQYNGDKIAFARESVLWGRKSSAMLTKVQWHDAERIHT